MCGCRSHCLDFTAVGLPQTKGSARAFMRPGMKAPVITNDNPKAKAWQGVVAHAAHAAGAQVLDGPVWVDMTFRLPRPKSHYRTGKNSSLLREDTPLAPCSRPDIDKLARVVLDALTGVAYSDDGQVARAVVHKAWCSGDGSPAGVRVRVGVFL
jgi:Holliday junction resolvase RusA-like endonuclease